MAAAPTPAAKTERLLNLVICLLYTRQPLSKQAIRKAVPQYGEAPSDEAFDRMFERDKDELRELGIPLRTEPVDVLFDDEMGYRVDRREYALPAISFETDELAVLALASRTWQQASLAGPAAQAMRKLQAQDVERDDTSVIGLEPRVRTREPSFEAVKDAALQRQAIRFTYRKPDGSTQERHVEPWSVVSWHGRWYVTGLDVDKDAPRVFRLSRVQGSVRRSGRPAAYDVPEHDALQMVAGSQPDRTPVTAVLRVREGAGHTVRRRAEVRRESDGWSLLEVEMTDLRALADELAGFGPAVVVHEPPELVEAVVARLRGTLESTEVGA